MTDDLETPNCARCLVALEVGGTDERTAVWFCPVCGLVRVA